MDSELTAALLARVQQGDREAFEQLFLRHRRELTRLIELRLDAALRVRVDASDIVQDTQFEAYSRLEDYLQRRPMPFRLWLRLTAIERLQKARRAHVETAKRSVRRDVPLPDRSSLLLANRFLSAEPSPSAQFSRDETIRRIRVALGTLSDEDRELLLMRNVERLSHRDVACQLGLEEAAARKRYGRALLRLRAALVREGLLGEDA
ncbi:MAG: sigma-70 family RNA polymerase sigma factor [Pirellulaceae bacterium]|nr:sigma-70 family RNA polymerase sigma factor [Pirellulaceae bacterium]